MKSRAFAAPRQQDQDLPPRLCRCHGKWVGQCWRYKLKMSLHKFFRDIEERSLEMAEVIKS